MNEFGHIADDLTSLEMLVERIEDRPHAKALKSALQRAFVEACKASRAQRLAEEGGGSGGQASSAASGGNSAAPSRKKSSGAQRSAQMGA